MKKKLLLTISVIILLVFTGSIIAAGGWDNFKLKSTQMWGYFTINNNPLLSSQDSDLESIDKQTARINPNKLLSGGPPKDGIPSIDNPKFKTPQETSFNRDDTIIGISYNGVTKAYPYNIMNWHEIVNDDFKDTPVAVTYCPLCDTNPAFIREIDGEETTFGVSGKLYNSCLVMFDRATDSLWSQVWGIGVGGEHNNKELEQIPVTKTTLGEWVDKHPDTKILSKDTGYSRDYSKYPYGSYNQDDSLLFSVENQENRSIHPKEIITYISTPNNKTPKNEFSGDSLRVINSEMKQQKTKTFQYQGEKITAQWMEETSSVKFIDSNGDEIPSSTAFGFVYPAYYQ